MRIPAFRALLWGLMFDSVTLAQHGQKLQVGSAEAMDGESRTTNIPHPSERTPKHPSPKH